MLMAGPFNVISPTSPYLAMWDTVQTKSSDRICQGSCVCVIVCARRVGWLMKFVCVHRGSVFVQAHTKLGVTMDSKEPFEVF